MDVVKNNIANLSGIIDLHDRASGAGTRFDDHAAGHARDHPRARRRGRRAAPTRSRSTACSRSSTVARRGAAHDRGARGPVPARRDAAARAPGDASSALGAPPRAGPIVRRRGRARAGAARRRRRRARRPAGHRREAARDARSRASAASPAPPTSATAAPCSCSTSARSSRRSSRATPARRRGRRDAPSGASRSRAPMRSSGRVRRHRAAPGRVRSAGYTSARRPILAARTRDGFPRDGDQATADGGLAPFGGASAAPEPGPGEGARPPAATLDPSLAARLRELPRAEDVRFAVWRPAGAGPRVAGGDAGEAGAPLEPGAAPAGAAPRATPADPLDDFFYREGEDPGPFTALAGAPPVEDRPAGPGVPRSTSRSCSAEEYAIAIERVREVLRCPPVTEVPRAPAARARRGHGARRRRRGLRPAPPARAPGARRPPPRRRGSCVDAGDGPSGSSSTRSRASSGCGPERRAPPAGRGRRVPTPRGDRAPGRPLVHPVLDLAAVLRRAAAPRRARRGGRMAMSRPRVRRPRRAAPADPSSSSARSASAARITRST